MTNVINFSDRCLYSYPFTTQANSCLILTMNPTRLLMSLILIVLNVTLVLGNDTLCIRHIIINGNKDVKRGYILREAGIQTGECYDSKRLALKLELANERLVNSGAFYQAASEVLVEADSVDVVFNLKEMPHWALAGSVDLPDRNFNVWWELKENIFDRLNFSGRVRYNNLTGKNNRISLTAQIGYAQKLQLEYETPYFDKAKKFGLYLGALVSRQQEINYATIDNVQKFRVENDLFLYQRIRLSAGLTYWPQLLWKHSLMVNYHNNFIDDFVTKELNANFFLNGDVQRFDEWVYMAELEKRDFKIYPEKGYYFLGELRKEGLIRTRDLDALYLRAQYSQYFRVAPRWSTEHHGTFRVGLMRPENLPYNNIRALGWENDFVRGYEFYMIDGLDFYLLKNSIRFKLIDRDYPLFDWIPFKRFRSLPLKVYISSNFDIGYANNPFNFEENSFANSTLAGGGFGVDFVGYHNMMVSFELSANDRGEVGVFLHYQFGIR